MYNCTFCPEYLKVTTGHKKIQEEKVIINVNLTLDSRLEGSGFEPQCLQSTHHTHSHKSSPLPL